MTPSKFLSKIVVFFLPIVIFLLMGILLPTTPRASKSLLMAEVDKNLLLKNSPSPRIIFVGGSNLCFGLNSQMIKDSLLLNPINTSIHASIGLKYMIDNTLKYVKKGDIVVLVPEYGHFYRSLYFGTEELMRTILDVNLSNIQYLNLEQLINITPFLPKYSLSKIKPSEYLNIQEDDIYSVHSFNQFGDTYTHWTKQKQNFPTENALSGEFNQEIINYFLYFNREITRKGAILLVSFPSFQDKSFDRSFEQIKKIEHELTKTNLMVLGTPEKYKMADSLMFNTPYHLNKIGVDYRTSILIQDIKNSLLLGE